MHPVLKAWSEIFSSYENIHGSQNGLKILDADQYWIHAGKAFVHNDKHSLATSTVHLTYFDLSSAVNEVHLKLFNYNVDNGPCDIHVYKNSVVSTTGSLKQVHNLNQTSVNTNGMRIYENPLMTTTGSQLDFAFIESAAGGPIKAAGGGGGPSVNEWILDPAVKYLIGLTNNSGGAINFSQHLVWYEPFNPGV